MRFRDGLLDGLSIGHAAGQVRHGHQESTALVAREWFDANGIIFQSHCAQSNSHDLELDSTALAEPVSRRSALSKRRI